MASALRTLTAVDPIAMAGSLTWQFQTRFDGFAEAGMRQPTGLYGTSAGHFEADLTRWVSQLANNIASGYAAPVMQR